MAKREDQQHQSPRDVPPVGRPRGAVWRALQADGVVWEGQVLLVGDDVDLAARMIVTHRRVVFVRGGELVLDIPRDWLRPEPVLLRDGVLDLFVAMPGSDPFDEPVMVPLRMREGHPAAGHIIAMLAPGGVRRILPESLSGMERAREAAPVPRYDRFWDEPEMSPAWDGERAETAILELGSDNERSAVSGEPSIWPPVELSDRVIRASLTPPRRPLTNGYGITGLQPRDQRKSPWGLLLRVAALALLLVTAAALGAGRLNLRTSGNFGSEAILVGPTPTAAVVASPSPPREAAQAPAEDSAIAIGVGGPATEAESVNAPANAPAVQAATETPVPELPTATVVPSEATIPTPALTRATTDSSPTAADVASVGTSEQAPGTPGPVEATPEPFPASQPAAVTTERAPAQEIVLGPLRLAVTSAQRAESLPRYGLPPGSGDWVLLVVDIRNEGDGQTSIAMRDFRLFDREPGSTIELDSGADVIAELAGFAPARSAADTITLAPEESAEALLLYLLPPGSSDDVAFLAAGSAMDLPPVLADREATAADVPELLQGTVREVLNGSHIVVDVGGRQETVQYLGMQTPLADACFATEATAANADLVREATVWLERQASDRGPDNVLLRDVWIEAEDGTRDLVAARLLEAGAGTAAPAEPDTRYQAWLQAAEALGRTNGAGLWCVCPEGASTDDLKASAVPSLAFMTGSSRERLEAYR